MPLVCVHSEVVGRLQTELLRVTVCVTAGAIEPLVKLIEAGGEGMKGQDSDTFKAEVVQHLLTLQVSHPQLREAIQEACCFSFAIRLE